MSFWAQDRAGLGSELSALVMYRPRSCARGGNRGAAAVRRTGSAYLGGSGPWACIDLGSAAASTVTGATRPVWKKSSMALVLVGSQSPCHCPLGLVVIEDQGPVLPLASEQLLRGRSLGELFDGPPGHAELTLDRAAAVPGFQQCMDGGVPGPRRPLDEPRS